MYGSHSSSPIWLGWNENITFSDLPGLILPEDGCARKWAIRLNWYIAGSIEHWLEMVQRASTLSFKRHSPKLNSPTGLTVRRTGRAVATIATSACTSKIYRSLDDSIKLNNKYTIEQLLYYVLYMDNSYKIQKLTNICVTMYNWVTSTQLHH